MMARSQLTHTDRNLGTICLLNGATGDPAGFPGIGCSSGPARKPANAGISRICTARSTVHKASKDRAASADHHAAQGNHRAPACVGANNSGSALQCQAGRHLYSGSDRGVQAAVSTHLSRSGCEQCPKDDTPRRTCSGLASEGERRVPGKPSRNYRSSHPAAPASSTTGRRCLPDNRPSISFWKIRKPG